MPVLEVMDAVRRFGARPALDGISLAVHAGERVALLGPNGAGKTTLVRAIAGRLRLDAGGIRLLGQDLMAGGSGGARAGLGVVPQEIALYHKLTARENLWAFGRFQDVTPKELKTRIAWALEWTGLTERAEEPVEGFSGGMKRRLNIACSVLHAPQVLLLDEPTVGVDPQSRERIYDMLEALRQEGTAYLLTTHHLDEAEARCDRILIIDQGRVLAAGTLEELVQMTIGPSREVTLSLKTPLAQALEGTELSADGCTMTAALPNLSVDLQRILADLASHGSEVTDLAVARPGLHAVFLHLTGRELRE